MKFWSVLLSDDDFCYMGLYFGFLFREVCAQVGPNMGLIWYGYNVKSLMSSTSKGLAGCVAWEGIEAKCLLVARDRFDRLGGCVIDGHGGC